MLKPDINWNSLRRALRAHRRKIFICDDCGYPWIADNSRNPLRCANESCRAGVRSRKYDRRGRPPALETMES